MSTPILTVENVSQIYPTDSGDLTVLRDISFEIEARSTCAIFGPSGSGKTTLLGVCAGLDRPSHGEVWFDGEPLSQHSEEQLAELRAGQIGFVFQNFKLLSTLTALENVMVPLELRGSSRAKVVAQELLGRVGLIDRLDHYPIQLSGGEQQRVAFARAFVHGPKILFADEPTGNLDDSTSQSVTDLLFELNSEQGTTLVIVTHNHELAARTGRQFRLRSGQLVEMTSAS